MNNDMYSQHGQNMARDAAGRAELGRAWGRHIKWTRRQNQRELKKIKQDNRRQMTPTGNSDGDFASQAVAAVVILGAMLLLAALG